MVEVESTAPTILSIIDRQFDISHSEHIDEELALQNVYWDCYGGRRASAETLENDESFEEIELRFYHDNYQDFVNGQNYRNECNGHSERNRSVEVSIAIRKSVLKKAFCNLAILMEVQVQKH